MVRTKQIEIEHRAPFSNQQIEDLASVLGKIGGIEEVLLIPIFSGSQFVLCLIVTDEEQCVLFDKLSRYDKKRHPPYTSYFASEGMRVYTLCDLAPGLSVWNKRSSRRREDGTSILQDALLLPLSWRQEVARLEQLYHSSCSSNFISALASRRPDVRIVF
jgi:hypothetical protein